MDFDLTKEQEMIRKEVRKFAQSEIAPIALDLDENETFSPELTRKMGEIGLFGMFVSEAYDGQEMDYISYIIAVEEIARVDGSQAATIAAGNSLGIGPLYYFGSEAQKKKYLPRLCRGEALWGFGLTEPTAGNCIPHIISTSGFCPFPATPTIPNISPCRIEKVISERWLPPKDSTRRTV